MYRGDEKSNLTVCSSDSFGLLLKALTKHDLSKDEAPCKLVFQAFCFVPLTILQLKASNTVAPVMALLVFMLTYNFCVSYDCFIPVFFLLSRALLTSSVVAEEVRLFCHYTGGDG